MKKAEIAERVRKNVRDMTRAMANGAVDEVIDAIGEALEAGDEVSLKGFGAFKVQEKGARKGRNPRTGDEVDIPAKKVVKFKPASALKERVNS